MLVYSAVYIVGYNASYSAVYKCNAVYVYSTVGWGTHQMDGDTILSKLTRRGVFQGRREKNYFFL
jgi:hypothetical protein